jgi:hypothetical protein
LCLKTIILPRQARDKHRESTLKKEWRFSQDWALAQLPRTNYLPPVNIDNYWDWELPPPQQHFQGDYFFFHVRLKALALASHYYPNCDFVSLRPHVTVS